MPPNCLTCAGKCCTGIIEVYSLDEIFYDSNLVREIPDMAPDRAMLLNSQKQCIALVNGRCSIYNRRPTVCRQFEIANPQCLQFQHV